MTKNILYFSLILCIFTNRGMDPRYDDFLQTALRSMFTDLPETRTLKQLKKLYSEKIKAEFDQLSKSQIAFSNWQWANLLIKASFIDKCDDSLESILKSNVNPNYIDMFGGHPLYYACSFGAVKNVILLLKYQADVNLKVCFETSLMAATKTNNLVILDLLLKHPNVDVNSQKPHSGNTPLILAVKKARKKINFRGHSILSALLNAKANPHIANNKGRNAIDIAREKGFDDLADLMEIYKSIAIT